MSTSLNETNKWLKMRDARGFVKPDPLNINSVGVFAPRYLPGVEVIFVLIGSSQNTMACCVPNLGFYRLSEVKLCI